VNTGILMDRDPILEHMVMLDLEHCLHAAEQNKDECFQAVQETCSDFEALKKKCGEAVK